MDNRARHRLGTALVAMQFALIGTLAVAALPPLLAGHVPVGAWAVAAASVMLGLWALSANPPGNFNVRPAPREGGQLVQKGPYRWIRHPMYSAVIAYGVSCAWAAGTPWGWISLGALVAVLVAKAAYEESWLLQAHPDYANYRAHTRRFLPGVF